MTYALEVALPPDLAARHAREEGRDGRDAEARDRLDGHLVALRELGDERRGREDRAEPAARCDLLWWTMSALLRSLA